MAIADFRPSLGKLELNTSASILTGNNAAFCASLLEGRERGPQASLESLTYVLPVQGQEGEGQSERPSVVVNLLMQLRASCDQNNFFLRTNQAAQAQVTARLHQVLSQCGGAVRAQAGEIERAIRTSLIQEEELSHALKQLEREVKKNSVSLSRPQFKGESSFWSGSLSQWEKGRTAQAERPEDFLRIQMHRSELLRSIGMRQEEHIPRRTASHPNAVRKAEESVPPEAHRTWEEWSGERLAYLQRESGTLAPEPPRGQEGRKKEMSRSAKRRRKDRKDKTTETKRTVQAFQTVETRRETRTRTVEVPETERIVQVVQPSETNREAQSVEVLETERTVQRVQTSKTHLGMPTVHIPKTEQVFETVQTLEFRQGLRMAGVPGPRWDDLPPQIWQQVLRRTFTPFNWPLIQSPPGARRIPVGETRAVLRVGPVFSVEELPSERAAFGRKIRIHSHNVTALGWGSPNLSGEEAALDSLSPEVRLLPQVTAAGQLLYRDSVIQSHSEGVLRVWRQVLQRNDLEIYRQVLERWPGVLSRQEGWGSVTERFRQRGSRRIPERTLQMDSVFRAAPAEPQSIPRSTLENTRLILTPGVSEVAWFVPARSVLEPSRPAAARDSRTFWRQVLRRAYAAGREIFRDASTVWTVSAGGSGAIRFIPVLHKEQLPGGTITSIREAQAGFGGSSSLDREGLVREFTAKGDTPEAYPAEGYTLEEQTAPDGLPPKVRLLSQPAAVEQAIYRVSSFPVSGVFSETVRAVHWQGSVRGSLTLYRQLVKRKLQEVRKQLVERMSPEIYRQVIERSAPEVYRQVIGRSAPEVYRQVIGRSMPEVYRRVIGRSAPEAYRQVIGRSAPEAYRQVIDRSAPEVYRQVIGRSAPEVYRQVIGRSVPEVYLRVIERSAPKVYQQGIERSTPEVFKRIARETLPKLVGRKVFRNVPEDSQWMVHPNGPEIFRTVRLESGYSAFEKQTSKLLRPVERRAAFIRRDTDTFVRETWTRNYILYRLFQQKQGTEPGTKEAALFLEGERGKEATVRRNGGAHTPGQASRQGLIHFAQPLEMAEGVLSPPPVYQTPEGERFHGIRPVSERNGHSSRRPEAEKAAGERDGEPYVQSVLTPEETERNPVIVYRSPAQLVSQAREPASAPVPPGQVGGGDVFRAQTVTPGQARALGQVFSYETPGSRREERGQPAPDSVPPPRAEGSMNYNRLTEEILVRLERRLRAERRKFGL